MTNASYKNNLLFEIMIFAIFVQNASVPIPTRKRNKGILMSSSKNIGNAALSTCDLYKCYSGEIIEKLRKNPMQRKFKLETQ